MAGGGGDGFAVRERRARLVDVLERDGMAVETAGTAAEGLSAASGRPYDAVVCAPVLPDADGLAFLRDLRSFDEELPVVMLAEDARVGEAFAAGATDCLPLIDDGARFERLPERLRSVVAWRGRAGERAREGITEDLKQRAMDEAPVGITLSDPSLPDNPLVYVNESYTEMTGYARSEALGRNCRFLQGPGSDEGTVGEMREAIDAGEPVSVELVNYRKDGSSFWNRVDVAPLHDDDGEVSHYVGFQTDITDRKRAEAAAKRYAVAASRERERLEHLIERTEGVLQDVTSILVQGDSREGIEATICERLVETEPYVAAWIGDSGLGSDVITSRTEAGVGSETFASLTVDATASGDDPTARAAATRSVQLVRADADALHPGVTSLPDAVCGMAAIPLAHRETLYGVLNVYTDDPDGLVALATAADCRITYEGSVSRDDGSVIVFATVDPDGDGVLDAVADVPDIERAERITGHEGTALYEFQLPSGTLVARVAEAGGRVDRLVAEPGRVRLTFEVADRPTARSLFAALRETYRDVELLGSRDRERPPRTPEDFLATLEASLTERQQTALQTAYLAGFFEWPHAVSGDDLADAMGISRSTFHQHLRVAQRKLLDAVYDPN